MLWQMIELLESMLTRKIKLFLNVLSIAKGAPAKPPGTHEKPPIKLLVITNSSI